MDQRASRTLPGLARADRRDREELARWVSGLVQHPERLEALAIVYAGLPEDARQELVSLLERTCLSEGRDPAVALEALQRVGARADARAEVIRHPATAAKAFEQRATGTVVLELDDRGDKAALVASLDRSGAAHLEVRSDSSTEEGPLEPIPLGEGVDRAARIVLLHLRSGGALPPGASRFAHLFAP